MYCFPFVCGFLLAASGFLNTAVASPSCRPGEWVNLAPIPQPRQEHGTAAKGNSTIAIVGGVIPDGDSTRTTNLFQAYDIPSDTWSNKTPTPFNVNHPNIAIVGENLYLLGGLTDGPVTEGLSMNWVASKKCYIYSFADDSWLEIPSMPNGTERGSSVVGVHGEMIYLAGGMTVLKTGYQDAVDSVISFNTTSRDWQRLQPGAAELPESRQHATGSVIGHTFYVFGGRRYGQLYKRDTVFELDLLQQGHGWKINKNRMPTARGGINGGAVDDKFFVFGGEGNVRSSTGVFNQSEVFDTTSQKWSELRPMLVARHGTQAVSSGGKIYIPGGGLQQDGKQVVHNGTTTFQNPTSHFDAYCP